jgi:Protein of unknown function (DUF3592)
MTVEASVERWVKRVIKNQALILRYMFIPQAIAGVLLLMVAYYIGYTHLHLILEGARAPGRVVGHQQKNLNDDSTLAFMPIVEFEVYGRTVRFEDWLDSASTGNLQDRVTVLYDRERPSEAMIDRPAWNWLPWAPIGVVGLFLTLVAIKGWLGRARLSTE